MLVASFRFQLFVNSLLEKDISQYRALYIRMICKETAALQFFTLKL